MTTPGHMHVWAPQTSPQHLNRHSAAPFQQFLSFTIRFAPVYSLERQPARAPLHGQCESTEHCSAAVSEEGDQISPDRSTCCCSNMEADLC